MPMPTALDIARAATLKPIADIAEDIGLPPWPVHPYRQHVAEIGRYLAGRWKKETPDIVHAHHWTSGLAALLALGLWIPAGLNTAILHSLAAIT